MGGLLVVAVFLISRSVCYALGFRFDASTIPWFDQLLDPLLLRTRFWESLFFLHGQPPNFNVLTALALHVAPESPKSVLAPVFLACGLYSGLSLYVILVRLGLPVVVAGLVASAALSSPPFVLYENFYFYPHLNVAWLLGGVAWLAQSRGRPGIEMSISALHFGGLSLTRSLFHPLFFVIVVGAVTALVARGQRRRSMMCFALPAVLLGAWCAKNAVLFHFFGTSSWGSRNVSHAVQSILGRTRVQAEVRRGQLSPAIAIGPFETGDRNIEAFRLTPKKTGIPALDDVNKRTPSGHSVSYNHWSYPASAHFYAADTRHLLLSYPRRYLHGLIEISLPIYLRPVADNGDLRSNRRFIASYASWFDEFETSSRARWFLVVGLALSVWSALRPGSTRTVRMVIAVGCLTIAWVTAVGIIGELGENYRFRYKVLWLGWAIALAGYAMALDSLRNRRSSKCARRPHLHSRGSDVPGAVAENDFAV